MIQSAIGFNLGFQAVSGVCASAAAVLVAPLANDSTLSPEGNTIPALRRALISRRTSASDGAPAAICTLPSASAASEEASTLAAMCWRLIAAGLAAGLGAGRTVIFATARFGGAASPQPASATEATAKHASNARNPAQCARGRRRRAARDAPAPVRGDTLPSDGARQSTRKTREDPTRPCRAIAAIHRPIDAKSYWRPTLGRR